MVTDKEETNRNFQKEDKSKKGDQQNNLKKNTYKQIKKELATYADTFITLQHIKSKKSLGIYYYYCNGYNCEYYKPPVTEHSEVSCIDTNRSYWDQNWKFNHSKLDNYQGYLKSNDTIINLSIKKTSNNANIFLRSHDIQFTIENDSFQEVVCHNERLGGNDEWCIELIKQYIWTTDALQLCNN
ncbi:hypothetical protein C1645_825425 [Glomus cerebriforme]|uniref:MIR domain-containing protein n=1 Tax=Glomus cerebriforme TaxID=658196 RepID=A0A397SZ22_9GLOM|nr:hypothetical protein C1645_825425 [Glomus cerebriforme]